MLVFISLSLDGEVGNANSSQKKIIHTSGGKVLLMNQVFESRGTPIKGGVPPAPATALSSYQSEAWAAVQGPPLTVTVLGRPKSVTVGGGSL